MVPIRGTLLEKIESIFMLTPLSTQATPSFLWQYVLPKIASVPLVIIAFELWHKISDITTRFVRLPMIDLLKQSEKALEK